MSTLIDTVVKCDIIQSVEDGTMKNKETDKKGIKRIGVLTSGGDCSGMNACIRSVVRTSDDMGIEVYGFKKGYQGILDNEYIKLDSSDVSGTIENGGTFLQSARCLDFKTKEGLNKGLENLKDLCIEGLIVIGGDGSLTGAQKIHETGFSTIGIPASIDNDLFGTDMSIGVDTALNAICNSVDMIRDTASSHERMFIIEVMGRNCGYLALASAIATGAEAAIIPEVPHDCQDLAKSLKRRYKEKKTNSILLVAEGAGTAHHFAKELQGKVGYDIRVSVLGHIQRGGKPTAFDRLLASNMGFTAVDALIKGQSGMMTSFTNNRYSLIPLSEVLTKQKPLSEELIDLNQLLE
jgi:6-phosphofructokinase 1